MKCSICKEKQALPNRKKCGACTLIVAERNKKYWKEERILMDRGKLDTCMRCKKNKLALGSNSRCEQCLEYAREKQRAYRDKK